MNEVSDAVLGRKIFFLYPSAVIQNRIIEELIQMEFEIYLAEDHALLRKTLLKYPGSIVFANINDGMSEKEWEAWIEGVMRDSGFDVDIGIITTNNDINLKNKYLDMIKVTCGWTALKADIEPAVQQLAEILKTADARGRRKFLRANTEAEPNVKVNLPVDGAFLNGSINDISVVGFSCSFEDDPKLTKNSLLEDIEIKLQAQIFKAEGVVFGSRPGTNGRNYVIVFTQRIDPEALAKIRKFIQQHLQSKMDADLKSPA